MVYPVVVFLQITSHFRIEKHRVARTIAERKTWWKYGLSKNDKPGPNPATTVTAEDVFMHVSVYLDMIFSFTDMYFIFLPPQIDMGVDVVSRITFLAICMYEFDLIYLMFFQW